MQLSIASQNMRAVARAQSRADQGALASPMLLHGAFAAEHLMLWGESAAALSKRRGATALPPLAQHRLASSPYDPGREALLAAIHASGLAPAGHRVEDMTVLLPSLEHRPHASSPLVAE